MSSAFLILSESFDCGFMLWHTVFRIYLTFVSEPKAQMETIIALNNKELLNRIQE